MIIKFNIDGSINSITGSNIFQYSAGANTIEMQINKPQDSTVTISLVKADGTALSAKPCLPKTGEDLSTWVYVFGTSGSPDLTVEGDLDIAFTVSKNGVDLNTEHYTGTVQVSYSSGYQPVDPDTATILQALINNLQLDKVGRYSVSEENLPYLPAEIVYDLDGAKTPNNLYYNFTADVIDGEVTVEKTGVLWVYNTGITQHEWFYANDETNYRRTIVGATVGDFTNITEDEVKNYTYSKVQADARFVHLDTDEVINGTKTFIDSPVVPSPTANTHAVNRESMYNYTYSKDETNKITQGMTVDTYAHFLEWITGIYTDVTPAGTTPADFLIGKKVYILEAGQNNYRCINTPITSISDFEVLAEDVKALQEITATPYKTLTATNGQAFVDKMKDEYDLKTQTTEEADLTILTTDWVEDSGNIYYDYTNANYTNLTNQRFEFISNDKTQNEAIIADKFQIISTDTIVVGSDLIVRLYANKVPSLDLAFKVLLSTYTNTLFEAGEIPAQIITYDNIISGLTATNVKSAIDELKGITDDLESDKVDKSAIKQTTGTSETDLMSQNAITSELNSKVNQSDFNALKSKLIYEDSSITFAKQMLDKENLYLYVSGVKSNVLTLLNNSNYNINFDLSFSYTDIDGSTTKTVSRTINTIVNCHFGNNLIGGFNKIIELADSYTGGALRKTLLQVNGEFSTGSSANDFQISSMYIRIVDSMGSYAVSDLDTLNFVLTDITGIRIVEMPYENAGE